MNDQLKKLIPRPIRPILSNVKQYIVYFGNKRHCPVCLRNSGRFQDAGIMLFRRKDGRCPWCDALERHRLVWLYMERILRLASPFPTGYAFLHIAPEGAFREKFRKFFGAGYLTADLFDPNADVKMNITNIKYPDNSFDFIYCSHVLEHVDDDRRAMQEFHRVLKPTGVALLLVPITVEKTFEDPTVKDPAERLRRFGQEDHVRCYGPDYEQRLLEAGFKVKKTLPFQFLSAAEIELMGITPAAGDIFDCRKN